jgi:hypothetical protein
LIAIYAIASRRCRQGSNKHALAIADANVIAYAPADAIASANDYLAASPPNEHAIASALANADAFAGAIAHAIGDADASANACAGANAAAFTQRQR